MMTPAVMKRTFFLLKYIFQILCLFPLRGYSRRLKAIAGVNHSIIYRGLPVPVVFQGSRLKTVPIPTLHPWICRAKEQLPGILTAIPRMQTKSTIHSLTEQGTLPKK
jgi:hypothetical protein